MCAFGIYLFFTYFGHSFAKEKVTYEGAQVWRTSLRSPVDVDAFHKLAHSQVISLWALKWKVADYLVQAQHQKKVRLALETGGLNHSVMIPDVQKIIDDTKQSPPAWNETTLRMGHRLNWKSFPRLNIINEYLDHLAKTYPNIVTLSTIGQSVENRPIKLLRITNGQATNKVIMVTSGIHAREWIAVTSAMYLIKHIAENFDKLPNYMQNIDWKVVPMLNPDGYEYSHTNDRLWRKNRRKFNTGPNCVGVDLNRNFGPVWFLDGVSKNCCQCDPQYPGEREFSEPETRAIRDYIRSNKPQAFLDVHAYGQLIMHPWGYKPEPPRNGALLAAIGDNMAKAIRSATGRRYIVGDTFHMVYQAPGIQMDWVLSQGVALSYTIEMRDSMWAENNEKDYKVWNNNGFLISPEEIKPTGEDLVAAMDRLSRSMSGMNRPVFSKDLIIWIYKYGFVKCTGDKLMCSYINPGCEPFSEPESRAIRDFLRLSKLPAAHVDLHSYGQLIMYPWATKAEPAHNKKILHHIAGEMAKEIVKKSGPQYSFGDVFHTIYPAPGTQTDWVFSIGINLSFALEMRMNGKNILGFILPPEYIEPTGVDLVAAVTVLAANIEITNGVTKGPNGRQGAEYNIDVNLDFNLGKVHK